MELIRGNIFFCTAVIGLIAFLWVWVVKNDRHLLNVFSHLRMKKFWYECKQAGKLIGIISFVSSVVVYVVCRFLNCENKAVLSFVFSIFFLVAVYLVMSVGVIKRNAFYIMIFVVSCWIVPLITTLAILVHKLSLDAYWGYAIVLLFGFDLIYGYHYIEYWKKGDIK